MPRTYVDNAYNRSLGRVGMPVGSMVVSRGISGSSGGSGYGGSSYGSGYSLYGGTISPPSQRTYVDNSYNRSAGRVGMPVGSMPISKGDGGSRSSSATVVDFSGSSTKTYVDNAYNRSIGRVGMPHGSMPVSKSDRGTGSRAGSASYAERYSPDSSGSDTQTRVYVDNVYNRKIGRVGLPVGTVPILKGESDSRNRYKPSGSSESSLATGTTVIEKKYQSKMVSGEDKVYKDNAFNRKLGRVGLPIGTAVYDKKTGQLMQKTYADNAHNRQRGRVGKPKGCMPQKKMSNETNNVRKWIEKLDYGPTDYVDEARAPRSYSPYHEPPLFDEYDDSAFNNMGDDWARQRVECYLNRKQEELSWMKEHQTLPETEGDIVSKYVGTEIPYDDLRLHRKIGQGGFSEVYFAKWNGTVVAVKKLRGGSVSKKRMKDFETEIMRFCKLDHPGLVQFIGACVERPNICIVMEYMQMSLFDALHLNDDIAFSEQERLSIIRQMCGGLKYLHDEKIAHCDLKSMNVLVDYEKNKVCSAKITDFGLSMMTSNVESSTSGSAERVANVGTPRYSAPEVLRGEVLSAKDMINADVYSAGLVMYEVVFDEEPFYDLTLRQLQKEVGEKGMLPAIPDDDDVTVCSAVIAELRKSWSFKPKQRPTSTDLENFFNDIGSIYED